MSEKTPIITFENLAFLAGGLTPLITIFGVIVGHQLGNVVAEKEVVLPSPPPPPSITWPRTMEDVEKAVYEYRASLNHAFEKYRESLQQAIEKYREMMGPAVERYRESLLTLLSQYQTASRI